MDPIAAAKAFAKSKQKDDAALFEALAAARTQAFLEGVNWLSELMQTQFAATNKDKQDSGE